MRINKLFAALVLVVSVTALSGCASINSAYDSVTGSVSDFFKSDDADKNSRRLVIGERSSVACLQ